MLESMSAQQLEGKCAVRGRSGGLAGLQEKNTPVYNTIE